MVNQLHSKQLKFFNHEDIETAPKLLGAKMSAVTISCLENALAPKCGRQNVSAPKRRRKNVSAPKRLGAKTSMPKRPSPMFYVQFVREIMSITIFSCQHDIQGSIPCPIFVTPKPMQLSVFYTYCRGIKFVILILVMFYKYPEL